ncbi:toxin-antitoxin system TumE family protein [Halobacterium noricense]|uniref:toxin-antitoxin system TumE family protein n=1 Tax=Halobacterium noricense TaxID=223182 RepID=UPI001E62B175|nr:DUF6516 family protein [Halobacterium noricense]UHH27284.1 DUF6516 family protein [Halobacterium noricense]
MSDEVIVLEDEIEAYADNTVARIRILDVPESDKFPEGVKYAFHYGEAGGDTPIIRFDNLYRAWRAALPEEKRTNW